MTTDLNSHPGERRSRVAIRIHLFAFRTKNPPLLVFPKKIPIIIDIHLFFHKFFTPTQFGRRQLFSVTTRTFNVYLCSIRDALMCWKTFNRFHLRSLTMKKTPQLDISVRVALAFMILIFSFSLPLTTENALAFATTPTSESSSIVSQAHPAANLIQAVGWADNFDSYATGVSLHGLGGWKGWYNDPAATAYTSSTQALSAPNSVNITSTADLVHEYSGYIAGEWVYTAWQYIPTGFVGESYFILMNQYNDDGSVGNWSVQVYFNGTLNQVVNSGISGGTLPLIKGTWVELRMEIDLTNDLCAFYYGGQLLYNDTWTGEVSGGGVSNIAALDLYANGATPIYYDDFSLAPNLGWFDNFDSYATGVPLHGLGGWKGWQNNPALAANTSSTQALSAPNSVNITSTADLVHEYSGYIAGEWVYTAWQYIPPDFLGESYFILMNQYDDAGTVWNWSVQVNFNANTNLVMNTGASGGTLPLIKGEWVELRMEIDLTNDLCAFYYGGQLLYQGTWTGEVSGGGIYNLAAVDLFANGATPIYYDDISLAPPPSLLYLPLILR
jgi:hypothetical protein